MQMKFFRSILSRFIHRFMTASKCQPAEENRISLRGSVMTAFPFIYSKLIISCKCKAARFHKSIDNRFSKMCFGRKRSGMVRGSSFHEDMNLSPSRMIDDFIESSFARLASIEFQTSYFVNKTSSRTLDVNTFAKVGSTPFSRHLIPISSDAFLERNFFEAEI